MQINKVIGEIEKGVFYFTKKNEMDFWANPTWEPEITQETNPLPEARSQSQTHSHLRC